MNFIKEKVLSTASALAWFPPLAVRIVLGYIFVTTGWGKLHNLESVTQFFQSLGIPAAHIQAPFVAGVELVCGFLVLIGLATRLASLPLIGTMVVAIITAKAGDLEGISDLFQLSEFLNILLFAWLFTAGPGSIAVDRLICKQCAGVCPIDKK